MPADLAVVPAPAPEPPRLAVSIREEWAVQYPPLVPGRTPLRYRCRNEWTAITVADGHAGATVVRREVTTAVSEWGTA